MRVCAHCHRTLGNAEAVCSRDNAEAIDVEAATLPADLVGRFQGLEPFAQSPQSACYLATQPTSGFRGLLKVIPLRDLDASERGRLKRELRKQVKLSHPNLPRIVDGGELTSALWLLRDHVDGESLGQRLRRDGALELSDALAITAQIASGLDELHRSGILHRDVRPSRVVLQPRDGVPIVKLLDAGIAARQRTGAVFDRLGTPAYMSPEQIAGKLVSFRSDLYALGCMLFEMLAGKPPFGAGEQPEALRVLLEAHQHDAPPALPVDVPPAVAGLLAALLEKDPRKRPFSAQQVRRTLEPLLPAGMPPSSPMTRSVAGAPSPVGAAAGALVPAAPGMRISQPGAVPPPKLALRASQPGALPPRPSASFPREEITEDIDLADVPQTLSPPRASEEPHTVELSSDDLASLPAGPLTQPPATSSSESSTSSSTAGSPIGASVSNDALAAVAPSTIEPLHVEPLHVEPPIEVSGAASELGVTLPAEEPTAVRASASPRRASVAFDVESLFNDPEPEPPPAVVASRPPDEEGPATLLYQPPGEAEAARIAYREALETEANQDRTVVVRAPVAPNNRKLWLGAGLIGAAIVVFAMCRSSDDDGPDAPAAAASSEQQARPAANESAAEKAAANTTARNDRVPAAQPTAEPAAEPAAEEQPGAEEPTAQAAQPGAEAAQPEAETAQPGAEAQPAGAQAAAANTGATPGAASAPGEGAATAEGGRAPPARSNRPDAVMGQRASRADRVAKANQLKAEGRAHYQAGRFREAARAYELATRETPSDGGAFAGLGASLLSVNDADGAIRAYQRAVQIDGQSSGFHAALGRAYALKGDRLRARASYTRALEINPKNGAAQQGLDRLKK